MVSGLLLNSLEYNQKKPLSLQNPLFVKSGIHFYGKGILEFFTLCIIRVS